MPIKFDKYTELRKLKVETLRPVIDILSEDESWKTLMKRIPSNPHDLTSERRYTDKEIRLITKYEADLNGRKKFAEILFEEWGCVGKMGQRPTLETLKNILIHAQLYRAANEIFRLLNGPSIGSNFYQYPAPPPVPDIEGLLPSSDTVEVSGSNTHQDRGSFAIAPDILGNTNLLHFDYEYLKTITNNFSHLIGHGGFGDVFFGYDEIYGCLAIKKARECFSTKQPDNKKAFETEVRSLSMLRHENIVPIVGISSNGPACIVIQYIDGGSLTKKIAEKVLTEEQRMKIIVGIAEGLKYIHHSVKPHFASTNTDRKFYFIHGDVKTDNILLTKDLVPKLCDFGLSKQITSSGMFTLKINGTSPYMAPECFRGTVTQKSDIYSFGIVLLQILTGSGPVILTAKGKVDIWSYLTKHSVNGGDISTLLDPSVKWTIAQNIFEIAKQCLVDKDLRPSMEEICEKLLIIAQEVKNTV